LRSSGPGGEETSIRVKTGGGIIRDMAKALDTLGIEVAA
jgi:hypothetical protein